MLPLIDLFRNNFSQLTSEQLWANLTAHHYRAEIKHVEELLPLCPECPSASSQAREWILAVRNDQNNNDPLQQVMQEFSLDSKEGVALMALSEALIRIPDQATALALLKDKLNRLDLSDLLQQKQDNGSNWVTGTAWGLLLSQQFLSDDQHADHLLGQLWQKLGESTLIKGVRFAIKLLSEQFVFAENIQNALQLSNDFDPEKMAFSFDMLGEAALCQADVDSYFQAYMEAIQSCGAQENGTRSSVSIKLTALHPRLENLQRKQVEKKLLQRMLQLLAVARNLDVAITIDAEESSRLELTLLLFAELLQSELGSGWGKLGLAVQAYSKRALSVLAWLEKLGQETGTTIPVRLVKGAYWDTEIKLAQQQGSPDYPVFTCKWHTDLSYLVCANFMLSAQCQYLFPQFATHNAMTIAEIQELAQKNHKQSYEFQRLQGMAEPLYQEVHKEHDTVCRIYAPIGPQQTLLPYLVRRLLENGASSSFVQQLHDHAIPVDEMVVPTREVTLSDAHASSSLIPLPHNIYLPVRESAAGSDLNSLTPCLEWQSHLDTSADRQWYCQPLIAGETMEGEQLSPVSPPYQTDKVIGFCSNATQEHIKLALELAEDRFHRWQVAPVTQRAGALREYAQALENNRDELISLCIIETGKTLTNAIDEVREAIDFCHYYAELAEQQLIPQELPGVTGETNRLNYRGRGVFLAISPWNFPLAIFTGQIAAALVAGNTVLAKPSSASSLIAYRACELWYETSLPAECLHLIPYQGDQHTASLINDTRIAGILFTGSTQTATLLNQQLASRPPAPIGTMVAETGGQNAMLVDSSALVEQVVPDIIRSAFNSAGQRCSALRVLYVQQEIAETLEEKLIGAMRELNIGNPLKTATDIGPVISRSAMDHLYVHIERMRLQERILFELPLDETHNSGHYVPPTLIRLHTLDELDAEHFGPVLHIIHFDREQIERVVNEINRCGYGLTLGIHSRNDQFIEAISTQVNVGNIYINRDQVGAVVAAQPFGGMGLSGTGPKAGGPHYLFRLVREQTLTRNTTASGGNIQLLRQVAPDNRADTPDS